MGTHSPLEKYVWIFENRILTFSSPNFRLQTQRCFEQAGKVNNVFTKDRILSTKSDELVCWLKERCPLDDPDSCNCIVISAYETFMSRTLNAAKKEKGNGPLTSTSASCSASSCLPVPRPPRAC
jgi:hypothetical protein